MTARRRWLACALLALGASAPTPARPLTPADVAAYGAVLERHVVDGWVDYRALKADDRGLAAFLVKAGEVSAGDYAAMDLASQEAFLINLYNAATLQLIVDHYPVKSIKDIGGLFQGPWDLKIVPLFGGLSTLHHVENGLRRPLGDPRIHAAIVCASKSCPRLRASPYVASRLNAQLDAAVRAFLRAPGKNAIDPRTGTIRLSPIFKWFRADFVARSGGVRAFIAPFLGPRSAALLRRQDVPITYFDYDWTLNGR